MTNQEVSDRWRKIVAEHLAVEVERVTEEASLFRDLEADSLDAVELLMSAEEEFGILITDEDAERCETFGDSVRIIQAEQQKECRT